MKGNQIDVSCAEVQNTFELSLNGLQINSVEGIQYFSNLESLECLENNLLQLPTLSAKLKRLDCSMNQLKSLPVLPASLEELSCAVNQLSFLPELPQGLKILYCNFNQLTALPILPSQMEYLACGSNQLTCLPELPSTIFIGDIALNPLQCVSSHQNWMDEQSLQLPVCSTKESSNPNKCICITVSLVDKDETTYEGTDQLTSSFTISPNPTQGKILITSEQVLETISVKDLEGKVVIEKKLTHSDINDSKTIDLDLSALINGVYFIQSTVGGKTTTYKVVKSN